jgi:hypothetical protein
LPAEPALNLPGLQATWALEGVTCQDVATQLNDQTVNNTLARAVIADFQTALIAAGTPAAAKTVVAVRQPCANINVSARPCQLMHAVGSKVLNGP